jgi:hypothetical protein
MYICTYCGYETENSGNFSTHNKTLKHVKNKDSYEEQNKLFSCNTCNGLFRNCELTLHIETCLKNQLNTEMVNKLNDTIEKLEVKLNKSELENKSLNEELKKYLSGDKEYLKTLVNGAGEVVNNAVKYLNKRHPNAPVFKKMNNFSLLEKEKDLFGMVISKYMNKVTYKYLGDVIRNYYVTDDPDGQTVWVSDVARLTYELKIYIDETNNKSKWVKDKKGVTICEEAIIPLLEFVRGVLIKKINILKNGKEYDMVRLANELVGLIDNGSLKDEINRYIAPFFQYKLGFEQTNNLEFELDKHIEKKDTKSKKKKIVKSKIRKIKDESDSE